jgi:hypothetical protein
MKVCMIFWTKAEAIGGNVERKMIESILPQKDFLERRRRSPKCFFVNIFSDSDRNFPQSSVAKISMFLVSPEWHKDF